MSGEGFVKVITSNLEVGSMQCAAKPSGVSVAASFSQASAPEGESLLSRKLVDLIDAHVHIWTDDFSKYPFAAGIAPAEMKPRAFTSSDILRIAAPSGVTRVVLVQMSCYGTDNSYMLAAIRQQPTIFRGIAVVDPESSEPALKMVDLAEHGVRGFRIYPPEERGSKWMTGDGIRKMFRCGARHQLALCLLVNPSDLTTVDRQCANFPETPVVIDHMARIGRDGHIRDSEIKALSALARYPGVKVKVSAFYALGKRRPPHLDLAPLIKRVFEAFGPKRLMWASDCPFQVESETYEDGVSLIRDRLDFLSVQDKVSMLRQTSEETFFR